MTDLVLVPLMNISNALFVLLIYLLKVCFQNNDAFDMRISRTAVALLGLISLSVSYRCPGLGGCLLSLLENYSNALDIQAFCQVLSCI